MKYFNYLEQILIEAVLLNLKMLAKGTVFLEHANSSD